MMKNQAKGSENTWKEDGYTFTELIRQGYSNCVFSAGSVEGHPVDTLYLMLERNGNIDTFLMLRPDEAAAIGWLMTGVLWSHCIGVEDDNAK
jgi:hypothetical protein